MTMKLSRLLLSTALILVAFTGIFLSQPAPARAANDWYVATTGSDITGDGSSGLPWRHIQFAIDDAGVSNGDTIHIAAGNYVEQVGIYKSLTLTGPGVSAPYAVIVAPDVRTNFIGAYDFIVEADGINVRLENLVINANNTILSVGRTYYAGVYLSGISGAGAGIFNCSILGFNPADTSTEGIAISGTSALAIDTCEILNFRRYGINSNGTAINLTVANCDIRGASGGTGIGVNGGTAIVNHNYISGGNPGIWSDATDSLTITDNEILNQTDKGIMCHTANGAGPVTIVHNTIHGINLDSSGYGIYNDGSVANGSIVNNEIYGCKTAINLDNAVSTWSVTKNLIHHCTVTGVRFEGPISVFSQNAIFDCVTGINVQANLLTAHCNAIVGNTTAGLALHNHGVFDVTNNYWGANSGPNVDNAGPGSGDKITTNAYTTLTYSPWVVINLTASPTTLEAGSGTSTITMDCTKNSAGASTGCVIPILVNAVFTTNLGSFSGATTVTRPLIAGMASTAVSSNTAGTATINGSIAEMPGIQVSTQVVFTELQVESIITLIGAGKTSGSSGGSITQNSVTTSVPLSNVVITSASISTQGTAVGQPVTVTAGVTNKGNASGSAVINLYLNDRQVDKHGLTLPSGGSQSVTFTVRPDKPGTYTVRVDSTPAGSFTATSSAENDIVLFSAGALVLVALAGLVYMFTRRKHAI